jgi:hypothetical protein
MPLYAVTRDTMAEDSGETYSSRSHVDAALIFARIDHAGQSPLGYVETLHVRCTAPDPERYARAIVVTNVDGWKAEDRGVLS